MMFRSVKDTKKLICQYEKEYNLFHISVDGIKIWQQIRVEIDYNINENLGIFDKLKSLKQPLSNKIINFFKMFYFSFRSNPFYHLKKVDYIVFSHPRLKKYNNKYIDIYTKDIVEEFEKDDKIYTVYEDSYHFAHFRKDKNIVYIDFIRLCQFFISKIISAKTIRGDRNFQIFSKLFSKYIINFDKYLITKIKYFKVSYFLYKLLFRFKKPKKIYLVVGYGKADIIKAAKDLSIEVVEVQHGVITPYHIGYNIQDTIQKNYFPDKFLTWGYYWNSQNIYALSETKKIIRGFWYFNDLYDSYKHIMKRDNMIVVISQGGIGEKLFEKIQLLDIDLKKYDLYIKLHPNEINVYKKYAKYDYLYTQGVNFCEDNVSIYELLSKSKFQIGVFSTAIFEGLGMGCKTLLFDLPGIEYMEDLLVKKYAYLVNRDNIKELLENDAKFKKFNSEDFFAKDIKYDVR